MPKKFIKRYMPDRHAIANHRHLSWLGDHLHDPNLWHLNRRSVAGAVAVGLFMAFVPVPFQMVLSAAAAIVLRVNLPIAVALVWITNPVTMPPMFYFTYKVGAWLMNQPLQPIAFELSWQWLKTELGMIWQPFLLGCAVTGLAAAALAYGLVRLLWRWHVIRTYRERRNRRGM